MDKTFLEQPLDRDLYKLKKKLYSKPKEPLRILVTDAGGKIAYNLIYEICKGDVFGEDQEVILHLISSRGSLHHKSVILELEECGFPVYKDFVITSMPHIAYKNVDVVIAIATFEEMPGRPFSNVLMHQLLKARQMALYIHQFAHKDCKIIFAGPSTKSLILLTSALAKFAPFIPSKHISCVTHLDVVISKSLLAAKLKTTTNKIKNVVVWANTFPDTYNSTVYMYPPGDVGEWEMKDVPMSEAIQDDKWLLNTFPEIINNREMIPELVKYGKCVTLSLVQHLKYLYLGSDNFDDIISMGVIAPSNKRAYKVPSLCGFSFPVTTENGVWEIREKVNYNTSTHLAILRGVYFSSHSLIGKTLAKMSSFIRDSDPANTNTLWTSNKQFVDPQLLTRFYTRSFMTPNPAEGVWKCQREKLRDTKKSIAWDDEASSFQKKLNEDKSTIRFSFEMIRNIHKRKASIDF